jgi:hypothetical protein
MKAEPVILSSHRIAALLPWDWERVKNMCRGVKMRKEKKLCKPICKY